MRAHTHTVVHIACKSMNYWKLNECLMKAVSTLAFLYFLSGKLLRWEDSVPVSFNITNFHINNK